MVLVHVKQSEDRQFLYECPSSHSVDALIREVVLINNLQLRLLLLAREGEQLCLHGPSCLSCDNEPDSDDEDHGEQHAECSSSASLRKTRGPFYFRDPSRKRTGEASAVPRLMEQHISAYLIHAKEKDETESSNLSSLDVSRRAFLDEYADCFSEALLACNPEVTRVLRKTLTEAKTCASKEQVMHRVTLNAPLLKEAVQNVRGAVMMCYPMGLPNHDPVHQLLNGTYKDGDMMDPDLAQIWWAGKELQREKKLSDHVGTNEKTKVIAKLQARGRAPPPREPPVDVETQKAMASWYYKQQQEQKKLDEDEDDSYTNSSWSNPKALKCHFQGTSCIRYR
ncbi:hypothetical protein L7F22_055117 [Adiantum nelumboides]|nr:hypothetical protein [Adiantum nelumboides]